MEDDAVLLVQRANEVAHLGPEHALHRPLLRRDDMHLDLARPQRGRDLEPDEARADHDGAARAARAGDDGAAVGERAQGMDMRLVGARDRQPHRLGAGRQQQPVVGQRLPPPASVTWRASASIAVTSVVRAGGRCRLRHKNCRAAAAASPPARCRRDSPSTDWAGRPAPRASLLSMTMLPRSPAAAASRPRQSPPRRRRRSRSCPAHRPLRLPRGFGCSRLRRTKMRPPSCSTCQTASGLSAGARVASPVRRSKQA